MSKQSLRDKIAAKIRALKARTMDRGCTEAEALSAANLAVKLMAQYDLTLTDVEIGDSECEQADIDSGKRNAHEIAVCCSALARFTDTKYWGNSKGGTRHYIFFGLPRDVELATYLHGVIKAALDSEWSGYTVRCWMDDNPNGRKEKHSFMLGMSQRIAERLREMKDRQNADTLATTGRDLMVVKHAVVAQEFPKLGIHLSPGTRMRGAASAHAHKAGTHAANTVGLNRPVGHTTAGGGYLITGGK